MAVTDNVSLKKKIELFNGLLLVAQSAAFFREDKKLLKSLASALKTQQKQCANSVYPMTESDRSETLLLISDLREIVYRLARVRKVADFRVWSGRLDNFVKDVTSRLDVTAASCAKDTSADEVKKNGKNG